VRLRPRGLERGEPHALRRAESPPLRLEFGEDEPLTNEYEIGETGPVSSDRGPPSCSGTRGPERSDTPSSVPREVDDRCLQLGFRYVSPRGYHGMSSSKGA